jgi:GT2 family glycosyltransferase
MINRLIKTASFLPNSLVEPKSWIGHLPFAYWFINEIKPDIFVELGTYSGNSYFSFCQSIKENKLKTKCFAVDNWLGDIHSGEYNQEIYEYVEKHNKENYSNFSRLLRTTFNEAVEFFENGSIDILHIDGLHTYEAVKNDFEVWLPKLSSNAFILFHDTQVRKKDFGVHKFWDEIKEKYPNHIEFKHSNGLGVVNIEVDSKIKLKKIIDVNILNYFTNLGEALLEKSDYSILKSQDLARRNEELVNILMHKDLRIYELEQAILERNQGLSEMNKRLEDATVTYNMSESSLKEEIKKIKFSYDEILNSKSWRLTKPLRWIVKNNKFPSYFIFTCFKKILRIFPIPYSFKMWIKNLLLNCYYKFDIQFKKLKFKKKDNLTEKYSEYNILKNIIISNKIKRNAALLKSIIPPKLLSFHSFNPNFPNIAFPKRIKNPLVSIIIPVFNNLQITLECLASISQFTSSDISYEVIVADDSSTDGSFNTLKNINNIKIFKNGENIGFIKNCNKALKQASGKYVLFLNNDTQVTRGWLGHLLRTYESYPNAGIVGPKFIFPNGRLQEAGATFDYDLNAIMIGFNENPDQNRFSYVRKVDYVSGACLLIRADLIRKLSGFSEEFLPFYCEDSDLCLRVKKAGFEVYLNPNAIVIHKLSETMNQLQNDIKARSISKNLVTFKKKWFDYIDGLITPRILAFYLPQFHTIPENDHWWGEGFTEWTNVKKAKPNFNNHYQPKVPGDLGYYDLSDGEVMKKQFKLATKYGIHGFCYYYYWFNGVRLLEKPLENMLNSKDLDFPFCLCWANENWTRKWDGQENEILIGQQHSDLDDLNVIKDLVRFFSDTRYIKINGKPLILIYYVCRFPDFKKTSERWRKYCKEIGIGEIYIAMVESFNLYKDNINPAIYGCDASVEFPPHDCPKKQKSFGSLTNKDFRGAVADYKETAVTYLERELPSYTRFSGVIPGWDNTARRQNHGFCIENSSPEAFQAWLEAALEKTQIQESGDERIVFVNAWNEWGEGAYLEPDDRHGYSYLEAVKNALDVVKFNRKINN